MTGALFALTVVPTTRTRLVPAAGMFRANVRVVALIADCAELAIPRAILVAQAARAEFGPAQKRT